MSFSDRSFAGHNCNDCPYRRSNQDTQYAFCDYYREFIVLCGKTGTLRCRQCIKNIEIPDELVTFSELEMSLIRIAFMFYKKYREGNPDVGMGPSDFSLLQYVFAEAGVGVPFDQYESILDEIRERGSE